MKQRDKNRGQWNSENFFGEDGEFDHVGIAVRSVNEAFKTTEKVVDPVQNVAVALVEINNLTIELVEPLDESSPVTKLLKRGQSIYHICFKVKDIQTAVELARKYGFHRISYPLPAKAFQNRRNIWLFSRTYGLVELIEK